MTAPSEPTSTGSSGDEPVEVLGPDGSVIGVVPRRRMRSAGLAHRATFVITVLAPPPSHTLTAGSVSDQFERWIGALSWPVLGPDTAVAPAVAPRELRPVGLLKPDTPVIVHRRADWKDVYPGYWDLAFGGVCAVAEPWLESAERELAEEAGLETATVPRGGGRPPVPVFPLAAGRYVDDRSETFGALFVAFADQNPEPADGEVVAVDRVPIGDLASWVDGHEVCPDSRAMVVPAVSSLIDPTSPAPGKSSAVHDSRPLDR